MLRFESQAAQAQGTIINQLLFSVVLSHTVRATHITASQASLVLSSQTDFLLAFISAVANITNRQCFEVRGRGPEQPHVTVTRKQL